VFGKNWGVSFVHATKLKKQSRTSEPSVNNINHGDHAPTNLNWLSFVVKTSEYSN